MAQKGTTRWGDDSNAAALYSVPESVHTVDRKAVPVHVRQVRQALLLVEESGVLSDLEGYRNEDGRHPERGGRPFLITDRQILTLMMILMLEGSPFQITRASDLVWYRMTKKALAELGIEPGDNPDVWHSRLWRAFQRVMRVVDPFKDEQRWRRFTKAEWAMVVAGRIPDFVESQKLRLHHLMNRLVWVSVMATPAQLRACWDGTIGFDGTSFLAAKKGTSARSEKVSIEANASWYRREDDHKGADPDASRQNDGKTRKRGRDKVMWAWEAILITMAATSRSAAFPKLILGVSFGQPGVQPTRQFWLAAENLIANDIPRGFAVADRQFLPGAKPERLQEPLRALGYRIVSDQIAGQTGQQASYDGAILVDGNWYCPSMPPILITIEEDFRAGRIDARTRAARLLRRGAFILREKERRMDGSYRYKCPAIGPGATCDCPLRKLAAASGPATGRTTVLTPPAEPRGICTQLSITIPLEAGAKYAQQGTQWGLKAWHDTYIHPRQTIEGHNSLLKNGNSLGLLWENHSRRPMRGYAAQALGLAFAIVSLNVAIATAFILRGEQLGEDAPPDTGPNWVRIEDEWTDPELLLADDTANAPGLAA